MAEQQIESLWRDTVTQLLQLSERPDSSVPQLNFKERSYLQLVTPVMLVNGYAVLSVPHHAAKTVIEDSLAPHITNLLAAQLGGPCILAVSVAPAVSYTHLTLPTKA